MRLSRIEEQAKQQDEFQAFEVCLALLVSAAFVMMTIYICSPDMPPLTLHMWPAQDKQQRLKAEDDARTSKNRNKRLKKKVWACALWQLHC